MTGAASAPLVVAAAVTAAATAAATAGAEGTAAVTGTGTGAVTTGTRAIGTAAGGTPATGPRGTVVVATATAAGDTATGTGEVVTIGVVEGSNAGILDGEFFERRVRYTCIIRSHESMCGAYVLSYVLAPFFSRICPFSSQYWWASQYRQRVLDLHYFLDQRYLRLREVFGIDGESFTQFHLCL